MTRAAEKRFNAYLENASIEDDLDGIKAVAAILETHTKSKLEMIAKIALAVLAAAANILICILVLQYERFAPVLSKMFSWIRPVAF